MSIMKSIKNLILLSVVVICSSNAYPAPEPFGIKLKKDTLKDVKKRYTIIKSAKNINNGFYNNYLDIKNFKIDTLSKFVVISNNDQVIEGVVLSLSKNKFDQIYETLSDKYETLSSTIPFVGDKYIKFQDDECYVIIDAPHMSFIMTVTYTTKNLFEQNVIRIEKDENDRKDQQKKMF